MSTVKFYNAQIAADYTDVTMAVLRKLSTLLPEHIAHVGCTARLDSGFLQWIVEFYGDDGMWRFTLGCVQRSVGDEVEFHS